MANRGGGRTAVRAGAIAQITALLGGLALGGAAHADSFQIGESLEGEYKLLFNYGVAMRTRHADPNQVNRPVDPLRSAVAPPGQVVGFTNTGLPDHFNFDDGNQNFAAGTLFNNRLSSFGEFSITRGNIGFVASGSAFYDKVYNEENDNMSPQSVNKTGDHRRFTDATRQTNGKRARILEAYVWGDFTFGERSINVKAGQHLAAWGESLFLSGIAAAQAPFDATKAFVPGAEIKEILLPINQLSFQLLASEKITLMGYYQLDYNPTEIFPVGDFFSPADLVGPGAEFAYGSINPAFADGCPGLFGPAGFAEAICNMNGLGGPLLNAPPNILVYRGEDIEPDSEGQWGIGGKYQLTPITNIGLYYLRFHNHNPTVRLNTGFAFIGSVGGVPITTELINQPVPVTYNIEYFGDIELAALSYSTVLFGLNVGGEIMHRRGHDVSVQSIISGVVSPISRRGNLTSALISGLYVINPNMPVYDEFVVVAEAGVVRVDDVEALEPGTPGITPVGDGKVLFYDETSWGYQVLSLLKGRNVFPGWDFLTSLSHGDIVKGNPSISGQFGALYGEGDRRFSVGLGLQYLQNLEFNVGYNFFYGDPTINISGSQVRQNPYTDRDYATFNVKYSL